MEREGETKWEEKKLWRRRRSRKDYEEERGQGGDWDKKEGKEGYKGGDEVGGRGAGEE